ncbi:hypothetical protein [Haloferula sp. A504]|uniref:hypothetical protein n=1 Tax=Haloferula sp. A504 TaxID=3373601 RepID=UPI0031BF18A5|nr:hypothetical protein [Verrucomicrobiaceae bacterium E54]
MRPITTALILCLLSCSGSGRIGALHDPALELHDLAKDAKGPNDLFVSYTAAGPVRWSQEWPWKLDLSGVAWDKNNTATVITPRHVVMAAHYIRPAGQDLVFHDRTGRRHARTVEKVVKLTDRGLRCDVAIGLLDRPLPPEIRRYPLPKARDDYQSLLVGATALVTEQKRKLYFHQIRNMGPNWLHFQFDDRLSPERRKSLISGDSGHPSFLLSKGELLLLETHTGGGPGSGPFYGEPELQQKMREVVSDLDPKYTFRTVEVDQRTLDDAATGRKSIPAPPVRKPSPQAQPQPRQPAPGPAEPRKPRPRVVRPPNS